MKKNKLGFAVFSWGDRCSSCGSTHIYMSGPRGEDRECADCGATWTD